MLCELRTFPRYVCRGVYSKNQPFTGIGTLSLSRRIVSIVAQSTSEGLLFMRLRQVPIVPFLNKNKPVVEVSRCGNRKSITDALLRS